MAERRSTTWFAAGFAVLLCGLSYLLFGDYDLGLADEGYLWYGVQRTVAGEVPLRDFQAYDPGRYYWCAAFAPLVGDGVLGLRLAMAAFQALGLTFALLVAARFTRNRAELAFCGLLIGLWMFPRHKLFEPALASMAVWFAVRLVEQPRAARHLAAGLYAGLAGFLGRNHALYAVAASAFLIVWLAWKDRAGGEWQRIGAWALGLVLGYSPMWAMFLFVPGFFDGFWYSNVLVLEHGSNLPSPYPWPWLTDWSALGGWDLACQAGLSAAFLLPCLALPIGLVRTLGMRKDQIGANAVLAAAFAVGLFYVHHMSVRSHWSHLAECLSPTLLLALALAAKSTWRWLRPAVWGGIALFSSLAFFEVHSLFARFKPGEPQELVACEVDGETLRLPSSKARQLENLQAVFRARVRPEEQVFIAPGRPAFYAVLGKVAPTWWIYFFWVATDAEQRELIDELASEGVDWVLVVDRSIDGIEERRFASTHPLVWQHLERDFERVAAQELAPPCVLFRRR